MTFAQRSCAQPLCGPDYQRIFTPRSSPKMKVSTKLKSLALAATLVMPFAAQGESTTATGAGALSTSARVDFSIVIPRILFLRVGSTGATIDPITFTVPAANVGNGVA